MRSAVLANARSRICFQLAAEDARLIASGAPGVESEDLQSLGAFEVYAQLVANGAVQPWLSARTNPSPPIVSSPDVVKRVSRERYGRRRAEVDAEVQELATGASSRPADIGSRRVRRGGS